MLSPVRMNRKPGWPFFVPMGECERGKGSRFSAAEREDRLQGLVDRDGESGNGNHSGKAIPDCLSESLRAGASREKAVRCPLLANRPVRWKQRIGMVNLVTRLCLFEALRRRLTGRPRAGVSGEKVDCCPLPASCPVRWYRLIRMVNR